VTVYRHGVDFAEYTSCSECDDENIRELEQQIEELEQQLQQARQEVVRECIKILRGYNGIEGIADRIMKHFGLEG